MGSNIRARKPNRSQITKKLHERAKAQAKSVVTFRLRDDLMSDFKSYCQKHDLSTADVLEELLNGFLYDEGG